MRRGSTPYVKYVVIDTYVWRSAQEGDLASLHLLTTIGLKCEYKVVIDKDNEILDEYLKAVKGNYLWNRIYSELVRRKKFIKRDKAPPDVVKKYVLSYIGLDYFDPSDIKFLQVAINVPDPIIISKDSDFLELRKLIHKAIESSSPLPLMIERLRKILTPEEAIEKL